MRRILNVEHVLKVEVIDLEGGAIAVRIRSLIMTVMQTDPPTTDGHDSGSDSLNELKARDERQREQIREIRDLGLGSEARCFVNSRNFHLRYNMLCKSCIKI